MAKIEAQLPKTSRLLHSDCALMVITFIVCLLFACVARLLNRNIGYGNAFNCDAWYFFGLQFHFADLYASKRFYQPFRFPALLPWIHLGNLLPYHLLNLLKYVFYFSITCAGFLWFNLRLFGAKIAILTTVLFCCSTLFLGVLSTDYLTSAGLAWISLLIGATIEAGRADNPWPWSILAGMLVGMCFFTHLPIMMFIFAVPLFVLAVPENENRRPSSRQFGCYLAGCSVGFCVMSIVLGLYNQSLGGNLFFIGPEIEIALKMLRSAAYISADNRQPGFAWLLRDTNVFVMAVAIAGCLILLVRRMRERESASWRGDSANVAAIVYIVTAGLVLGWEFSGRVILQVNVFAPWIYPVLFAAFAGMLSRLRAIRSLSVPHVFAIVFLMWGTMLMAAAYGRSSVSDQALLIAKVVSGLVFMLAFALWSQSKWGLVGLASLVSVIVLSYPTEYGSFPWMSYGKAGREMTIQATQAARILASLKLGEIPAFWVGASQPETIAVPRSFMNCGSFAGSFPSTGVGTQGMEQYFLPLTRNVIGNAHILVVVAHGKNHYKTAASALQDLGFGSQLVGEWPIGYGSLETSMAVLRLTPSP